MFRRVGSVQPRSSPSLLQFGHAQPSSAPFLPRSSLLCSSSVAHHRPRPQFRSGSGHLFSSSAASSLTVLPHLYALEECEYNILNLEEGSTTNQFGRSHLK
ncbi:hypothetical protein S83_060863 [Arachis hypogaea]